MATTFLKFNLNNLQMMFNPNYSKMCNLNLMSQSSDPVRIGEASGVRIEEDDGLEAGELRVVHLNVAERVDQFGHDPHPDVVHDGVLEKRRTKKTWAA